MHPIVYAEFEKICSQRELRGAVLEVGATPDASTLLTLPALKQMTEKIGLNLNGPSHYADFGILQGDANAMLCFEDGQFDAVLCNATLEHDRYFWKTLAEIKRVSKTGGLIVIGVPGFQEDVNKNLFRRILGKFPFLTSASFMAGTKTLGIHKFPGDYYRFSPQAVEEVFLEGLREVKVCSVLSPPRVIGYGIKV
jgi:SAM-dependent methyltransferase